MPLDGLDWSTPDYGVVINERATRLRRIRTSPTYQANVRLLKAYYRDNPWQFIHDWGVTSDPRNIDRGVPSDVPFVLFSKQVEWLQWVHARWQAREPGVTEKSRDCGVSWLAIGYACSMCLHHVGFTAGFGSRKAELVDKLGDPDSLFWKARFFLEHLPREFRCDWTLDDSTEKLIRFPKTRSSMIGEGGDEIGRGGRSSIYFVDESSRVARPMLNEASLSANTNCRQDISSANGTDNPFYAKVSGGKVPKFTFHWRDDPRKDQAWYDKQCDFLDPIVVAAEIDIDYHASIGGVVIPSAWVQSAVDAHVHLGVPATGDRRGAFDVADEGSDLNAFCGAHGVVIERLEEWSGKGSDIHGSTLKAFGFCDELGYAEMRWDQDGLGAGVRGDARVINEARAAAKKGLIKVVPFRGSDAVTDPEKEDVEGRKNEDFFANFKAQSWWQIRTRFQLTHRAVTAKKKRDEATLSKIDLSKIISIPSGLPLRAKLSIELSRPTWSLNGAGKILIDKAPDGTKSPNLADSVMIRYAKQGHGLIVKRGMAGKLKAAMQARR